MWTVKTNDGWGERFVRSSMTCTYHRSDAQIFDTQEEAETAAERFAHEHGVRAWAHRI